jgi:hypothetical protein
MSGPLLAIIGCGVTIWLANTHPDLPVSGVERHGLVVEKTGAVTLPLFHESHNRGN